MTTLERARGASSLGARASGSIGAVVLAALVPKCPICVAAALSALGVGAGVSAAIGPMVRPAALVSAALALVLGARALWRWYRGGKACANTCAASARGPR